MKWQAGKNASQEQHLLILGSAVVAKIDFIPLSHYWPDGVCRLDEGKSPATRSGWRISCSLPVAFDNYESNWITENIEENNFFSSKEESMHAAEKMVIGWMNKAQLELLDVLQAATAIERERCAKIAEDFVWFNNDECGPDEGNVFIAKLIRGN